MHSTNILFLLKVNKITFKKKKKNTAFCESNVNTIGPSPVRRKCHMYTDVHPPLISAQNFVDANIFLPQTEIVIAGQHAGIF